ncbi:GNAT family N-acetyltransferase [Oceanobacillus sp. FSL K6-2867]|uniref:GNAT family N-acetyltransferase n=1 Tax=Oceanobacillus sp. FSL K6-2867 TaxID=2954748 RepID=UPI0030DC8021
MNPIKKLSAADYNEIFELSQFAFQYKLSEADLLKKKEEAERHIIWGWMEEGRIAAKLHLIPLSVYINGKHFEMGGVSAVATWPEYRRNGMVKQLLAHAIKHMKKNGQMLSYLHPFSVPFYRKFGWEVVFNEKHYTIPMEALKRKWDAAGYVRRTTVDIELFHSIYTDFAKQLNGSLVRDEKWWKQRVLAKDMMMSVCYDDNNRPEGYIFYNVKDRIFEVKELVYRSLNGWKLLLNFIANHDSMAKEVKMTVPENDMLPLLIGEPRFKQAVEPYFMGRIVDVPNFLKSYPFNEDLPDATLLLHVKDHFLPENSGSYDINVEKGSIRIFRSDSDTYKTEGIHCDVQQLTSILLGYRRSHELAKIGLIQADTNTLDILEKLIPVNQTFLADYF